MKKNRLFVLGLVTVFVALVSLTFVSSTWAKYTTTQSGQDSARVAYWGFNEKDALEITDLFVNAYDSTVNSTVDVIAPGTSKEVTIEFNYDNKNANVKAPEVNYNFKVSTKGSSCHGLIEQNENIVWTLDEYEYSTFEELCAAIELLSGDASGSKNYNAGELPAGFKDGKDTHTIGWYWTFDVNDAGNTEDTTMGNVKDDLVVKLVITITATQVD